MPVSESANGKFLLMAGGTGGHLFPALALARKLRSDGFSVEWIGSEDGFEGHYVKAENIPLHNISIKGVRGKGLFSWLAAPLKIVRAVQQARNIVKEVNPDCVVGMGGFAAGPGGIAAWLAGKPLVIHEQNAVAGLTNRILFFFSKRVLQAFPQAFGKQSKNIFTTGNPVRSDLIDIEPYEIRKQKRTSQGAMHLLVLGGSQGALAINQVLPEAIAALDDNAQPLIWHQAGRDKDEVTRAEYKKQGVEARVDAFVDDMAAAYAWADLVICRAGALTVAELAAVGVGSILIPYPQAVDDHQTKNADYLAKANAALIIQQSELNADKLAKLIESFKTEPESLEVMAKNARSVGIPDSVEQVANLCKQLLY